MLYFLRKVFGEEDEKQSNGKVFKKLSLGDYVWMNYKEADKVVTKFGSGLASLGLKPRDTVSIYAETRQVRVIHSTLFCFLTLIIPLTSTSLNRFSFKTVLL